MNVSPTESRGRVKGGTPLWKGKRMKRKLLLMLLCAALGLGAAQAEVYRVENEADVPADWAEKDTLRRPALTRTAQMRWCCNPAGKP